MLIDTDAPLAKRKRQTRFASIGGSVLEVGKLRYGTEVDVTGRSMRRIPGSHHYTRCDTWISKDGLARRRHYNWVSGKHEWEEQMKGVDASGKITISTGGKARWTTVARAIALAWVDVPSHLQSSRPCAVMIDREGSCEASNVGWVSRRQVCSPRQWIDPQSGSSESEEDEEEVWRPLKYRRRTVHTLVDKFEAQSHGRVWVSSNGRLTNEVGALEEERGGEEGPCVSIGVYGTVPVADAVAQTFGADGAVCGVSEDGSCCATSIKLVPRQRLPLRPSEQQVYDSFLNGETLSDIARARGCMQSTAKVHLTRALGRMEMGDIPIRVWERLIPSSVRRAVQSIYSDRDEALSGTLTECMQKVDSSILDREEWEACDQWFCLRVARLFAMRTCMHRSAA